MMRTIKRALDPHNIMNPGKIFLDVSRHCSTLAHNLAQASKGLSTKSLKPACLQGLQVARIDIGSQAQNRHGIDWRSKVLTQSAGGGNAIHDGHDHVHQDQINGLVPADIASRPVGRSEASKMLLFGQPFCNTFLTSRRLMGWSSTTKNRCAFDRRFARRLAALWGRSALGLAPPSPRARCNQNVSLGPACFQSQCARPSGAPTLRDGQAQTVATIAWLNVVRSA